MVKTEVFFWLEWWWVGWSEVLWRWRLTGLFFYISLFCSVSVQAVYEIFRIVFLECGRLARFFLENSREVGKSGIWRIFSGCSEKRLGTRTKAVKTRTGAENGGNKADGNSIFAARSAPNPHGCRWSPPETNPHARSPFGLGFTGVRKRTRFRSARNTVA